MKVLVIPEFGDALMSHYLYIHYTSLGKVQLDRYTEAYDCKGDILVPDSVELQLDLSLGLWSTVVLT